MSLSRVSDTHCSPLNCYTMQISTCRNVSVSTFYHYLSPVIIWKLFRNLPNILYSGRTQHNISLSCIWSGFSARISCVKAATALIITSITGAPMRFGISHLVFLALIGFTNHEKFTENSSDFSIVQHLGMTITQPTKKGEEGENSST